MSNENLVADVNDELRFDPKVDSEAIAVAAQDGVITLRGTVGSLRQEREARKAAERIRGVARVDNQLKVRPMGSDARADADLRGAVLRALMLDSVIPRTIDASVDDGLVTLTGHAEWQYQRAKREVIANQQWKTVQEEDGQNQQLLDLSHQILELTKAVHEAVGTNSNAAPAIRE